MQFDEKVLTALEVLTDAAENDFELYRICTLVRDLISPPVAEQVDEKHQRFNGVTYYKTKDGHYARPQYLHCDAWCYYHGDIPRGGSIRYDVHHSNLNPADNNIANLVLLTRSEHAKIHSPSGAPITQKKPKTFVCECCGREYRAVDNGKNRYCPECRTIIKAVVSRRGAHTSTLYEKTCPVCGKKFTVANRKRQLCCSQSCAAKLAWLRGRISKKGYHKVCPVCAKEFDTPYDSKIYCSKECACEAAKQCCQRYEKVCENCGANFRTKDENAHYCSKKCATEMLWKKRKAAAESAEKAAEGVNIVAKLEGN